MTTDRRLTYCGNVHATLTFDAWLSSLDGDVAEIARGREGFGLGVWWPNDVVQRLRTDSAAFDRARDALAARGLHIETLNVFPFGGDFHDASVKTAVYSPDWGREERLEYTKASAEVAARMVAELAEPHRRPHTLPMSTLPLGYGDVDLRRCARNLARAASACAAIEERTGVRVVLAMEPEPFCVLERVDTTAEFLVERVFSAPDSPVPEDVLRRHLGVCIDLCHLAVVGEDPVAAWDALLRAEIAMPKVQISSCLELRSPATALDQLLAFDEERYLHQTVSFDGALRALDLGDVTARRDEFARADGLRTHFHLPVFWDDPGSLGSTQTQVERFVRAVRDRPSSQEADPVLEVETYTWTVLDPAFRAKQSLAAGIRRELEFVESLLRPDAP